MFCSTRIWNQLCRVGRSIYRRRTSEDLFHSTKKKKTANMEISIGVLLRRARIRRRRVIFGRARVGSVIPSKASYEAMAFLSQDRTDSTV